MAVPFFIHACQFFAATANALQNPTWMRTPTLWLGVAGEKFDVITSDDLACTGKQHSWDVLFHLTGNCESCMSCTYVSAQTVVEVGVCAGVQGQTQGQLDKLQEDPNHWTFLTGATVASLPVSRLASTLILCILYSMPPAHSCTHSSLLRRQGACVRAGTYMLKLYI